MDENDFDQILQTDFHPNTAPPPPTTEHQHLHDHAQQLEHEHEHLQVEEQQQQQEGEQGPQEDQELVEDSEQFQHQQDTVNDTTHELLLSPIPGEQHERAESQGSTSYQRPPISFDYEPISGEQSPSAEKPSAPQDKKAVQRELNRLAALRSREKKKGRYDVLEQQVTELSDQNEKLRARLDKLLAERPGLSPNQSALESTPLPESTTEQPKLPEVDHRYFRKVVTNLEAHKYTLLTKEIELERFRKGEHDVEMEEEPFDLRERLMRNIGNKILAEAEVKSIEHMIRNLRLEKVSLTKERDTVTREVDARMAVKEINGVGEDGTGTQEDGVEKVLLQVKGWIDETLAKWADEPDVIMNEPAPQPTQFVL